MEVAKQSKHFVLVHGSCHGAWCWYKIKPRLESDGHRVTTLDLAASGINTKEIQEMYSLGEYTKPLLDIMESIPENEKVILVGHSYGGMSLALAMDMYPSKISVAVFMAAFMPDTVHKPSYVLEKYNEGKPLEAWMDSQFLPYGTPEEPQTTLVVGPIYLKSILYPLSPIEDFELALTLVRPASLFVEDLKRSEKYRNEGYGSVTRVYFVNIEDETVPLDFQRWMIENNPVTEMKEIEGADHMLMFTKPDQVCQYLLEIAYTYA